MIIMIIVVEVVVLLTLAPTSQIRTARLTSNKPKQANITNN